MSSDNQIQSVRQFRRFALVVCLVGVAVQLTLTAYHLGMDLYFPAAPIGGHLLVLALYAGIGGMLVLVTNMLPNRGDRTSEVDLEVRDRIEGNEHREPVVIPPAVLDPL